MGSTVSVLFSDSSTCSVLTRKVLFNDNILSIALTYVSLFDTYGKIVFVNTHFKTFLYTYPKWIKMLLSNQLCVDMRLWKVLSFICDENYRNDSKKFKCLCILNIFFKNLDKLVLNKKILVKHNLGNYILTKDNKLIIFIYIISRYIPIINETSRKFYFYWIKKFADYANYTTNDPFMFLRIIVSYYNDITFKHT